MNSNEVERIGAERSGAERSDATDVEPHIYIMRLKKMIKKMIEDMKRSGARCNRATLQLINKIYVVFDAKTMMPESIELHYASEELENEYSFKGSQVLHRLYKFPKTPLKFYKELTAETTKLVLICDNWKSKWQVNECKQE